MLMLFFFFFFSPTAAMAFSHQSVCSLSPAVGFLTAVGSIFCNGFISPCVADRCDGSQHISRCSASVFVSLCTSPARAGAEPDFWGQVLHAFPHSNVVFPLVHSVPSFSPFTAHHPVGLFQKITRSQGFTKPLLYVATRLVHLELNYFQVGCNLVSTQRHYLNSEPFSKHHPHPWNYFPNNSGLLYSLHSGSFLLGPSLLTLNRFATQGSPLVFKKSPLMSLIIWLVGLPSLLGPSHLLWVLCFLSTKKCSPPSTTFSLNLPLCFV